MDSSSETQVQNKAVFPTVVARFSLAKLLEDCGRDIEFTVGFPLTSGEVLLLGKLQLCLLQLVKHKVWRPVPFENELALAAKTGFPFSTCTELSLKIGDSEESRLRRG